jgi:hypothetical protein
MTLTCTQLTKKGKLLPKIPQMRLLFNTVPKHRSISGISLIWFSGVAKENKHSNRYISSIFIALLANDFGVIEPAQQNHRQNTGP